MFCKNCGKEIDDKSVMCPQCGVAVKKGKKSLFKRWWFWLIVVLVLIIAVGTSSDGDDSSADKPSTQTSATASNKKDDIVYETLDLKTIMDELEANALKAEKTYQDKYVEVVGKISNFDSDGSYFSIEPVSADEWNFDTVTCKIKNDEQLNFLLEKSVGDTITVKGQITDVGEILGYTIKVAEVN